MGTEPQIRIWWVRIEAIGDQTASATNKLYRWSAGAPPSWDTDSLYRHALGAGIDISAQSIDPRSGKASSGGMSFSLNAELGDPHEVFSIFGRHRQTPIGSLAAGISATDTGLSIGDTGAAGTVVYINREAILLGTHLGFGVYAGCTRGVLETSPQRHRADVPVYSRIKVKRGRRVVLGYYDDDATSYSDEVEFQSYQMWDGSQTGLVRYDITCDGFLAILSEAEMLKDQWVADVATIGGHAGTPVTALLLTPRPDYREGSVVRLPEALRSARTAANGGSADTRGGVGADPAEGDTFFVSIDGVVHTAIVVLVDIAAGGEITGFAGYVKMADPLPFGGVPLNITPETDIGALDVRECFPSSASAPDNNGSGTGQLPLGSGAGHHPLAIWLQVVTSTIDGTNGAYDTGVEFGLRMPVDWIDLDSAEKLIDTDPEDFRAERYFAGREQDAGKALEELQKQLLAPAGIQQTEGTDGRISFTRITDSDYLGAAVTVGEDQLVLSIEIEEDFNWSTTLDKLKLSYDRAGDGKSRSIPVSDNENTDESLGPVDTEAIDGGSFQSRDLVLATGLDYLQRWREDLPTFPFGTTMDVDLRSGDSLDLTCKAVLGWDSTNDVAEEGVTASRVLVVSRGPNIEANHVAYVGMHIGINDLKPVNVAPSFRISGANTGESVPVDAAHFVGTDHVRGYTDDIDPWLVGESAVTLDGTDLSIKESGLVVASLVSGTVVLTGLTVAVVAGDFIVPDTFASSTTRQQERWEYFDEGKQYEG